MYLLPKIIQQTCKVKFASSFSFLIVYLADELSDKLSYMKKDTIDPLWSQLVLNS